MEALNISVETGWPTPDLWPNSRVHHMRLHSARKAAKREAYWATNLVRPRGWNPTDGERFKLTIHAHPSVERNRDDDGLIGALKGHRDGIAEALKLDDSRFDLQPVQWGEKHPRGRVYFTVESAR